MTTLKKVLVSGLSFSTADAENGAGRVAVNDDGGSPEAVGFYFYESLDRIMSEADKKRIGGAIIELFNFAVQAGAVSASAVGEIEKMKVGYSAVQKPLDLEERINKDNPYGPGRSYASKGKPRTAGKLTPKKS